MVTREQFDVAAIGGNVSKEIKQTICNVLAKLDAIKSFESEIASRVVWTEFSVVPNAEEPERSEGRSVCEITVTEDMLNGGGTVHGACFALLIDGCSTMPIALLSLVTTGKIELGVSLSLNILYHAPAVTGDRLRIVSTTISLGGRTLSSRCEIWNVTQHRLAASGVQAKMTASTPRERSKL